MQKVTGIGGVVLKAKDAKVLSAWYQEYLGIAFGDSTAATFKWINLNNPDHAGITVFSFFKESTKYFQPGDKPFMINFRVEDLLALLEELNTKGVLIVGEVEEYEYGKFGWIMDPEGNKIELWEPLDEKLS